MFAVHFTRFFHNTVHKVWSITEKEGIIDIHFKERLNLRIKSFVDWVKQHGLISSPVHINRSKRFKWCELLTDIRPVSVDGESSIIHNQQEHI